jgi:signal transduction histidine kinase/DNA-binding response OmpR family regulator
MLYSLLNVDARALIAVIIWGNFAAFIMVIAYRYGNRNLDDRRFFGYYSLAKFCLAAGFFFLFFRGVLPDLVSVNLGNSLVLTGFFLDASSMLIIIQEREKRPYRILLVIFIAALLVFNSIEFLYPNPSIRVASASFSVFLLLVLPGTKMLRIKNPGHFMRSVTIFYLIFVFLLLPRGVNALINDAGILTSSFVQSLTFIALIMLLILEVSAYLLFKQKADEASQSKSIFLATMSHEIRTPLNAIIGITEIQLQKNRDPDTHAALERIYNSGFGLLGIINDVLDISKIETGNLELIPVEYKVSSLVNDTVLLNMVRIGSKPIIFELEIDENIPVKLYGDELRVKQILNNFLSNAIKYTREGKVTLKITWTGDGSGSAKDQDGGVLGIQISDTGQGIKEENIGKLFSQYGQLDALANRHIEGTGLGLSITKNLVELMQGTIHVESVYGRGSVFTVTIRQRVVDPMPLGKETVQNLKHFRFIENRSGPDKNFVSVHIPDGKILVVDDVETNLYVARGLLQPYGLVIDCVTSGQEAIDKICTVLPLDDLPVTKPYDIVFMDHMMPGMDGVKTVELIREWERQEGAGQEPLPIIALTANAIVGMREMFLEKGFNDYLSKPISRSRLDEILVKWIPREKQHLPRPANQDAFGASKVSVDTEEISIEGVDFKQGLFTTGGSLTAYREILTVFSKDAAGRLSSFGRVPTKGELSDFIIQVHALKSAAANIGAAALSQKAALLEAAGRQGYLGTIGELLGSFHDDLEILIKGIRAALEPAEGRAEDQAIPEAVRDVLTWLRAALENEKEIRPIDTLLRQLKEMDLSPSLQKEIAGISDSVILSEFSGAKDIIDDLLKARLN